jgi:hypothetical protein
MKTNEPPRVPDNRVSPRRGVAGYVGNVIIVPSGKAERQAALAADFSRGKPPAAPVAVIAYADLPAELQALLVDDALASLPRNDLVHLAVTLGLRGQGKSEELIAAIRGRRAQLATPPDASNEPGEGDQVGSDSDGATAAPEAQE